MYRLLWKLVVVTAALTFASPAFAHTITLNGFSGSYLSTVANDAIGDQELEQLNPAALPFSQISTRVDGAAQAQAVYELSNAGFRADVQHTRPNLPGWGQGFGAIYFTTDEDIHYTAEGTYTAVDPDGRTVRFSVDLFDHDLSTYVFRSLQESQATPNEAFTLGLSEGDFINTSEGSLTGTLIAGHNYQLFYNIYVTTYPTVSTTGATATGFIALSFTPIVPPDPDRFLTYFNSVASEHEETAATAAAYHDAIDPYQQRLTLDDWLTVNGFGPAGAGADAEATYVNDADLGFGRHMFIKTVGNDVASYVQNYTDNTPAPGGDPVDGSAEEKITNAHNGVNLLATVAMEYARPEENPDGEPYTRFYAFGSDGARLLGADLDGRGLKFIPGVCTACHGGSPLPLVDNGTYPNAGDIGAGFLPWDLDTLKFSNSIFDEEPRYSRAEQEAELKIMNEAVLNTNPTDAAREVIEGWYAGTGVFDGSVVPAGWTGHEDAYREVYAPNCRACHVMRNQAASFQTFAEFQRLVDSDRVQELVFDRGVMPLARRTYDHFWTNLWDSPAAAVDLFGEFPAQRWPGNGAPHASAGPDRPGDVGVAQSLDATSSSYASSFEWLLQSAPPGSSATLSDAFAPEPSFTPDIPGNYVFELTGTNLLGASTDTVTVSATTDGSNPGVDFETEVLPIFEAVCKECHSDSVGKPDFNGAGFVFGETAYIEAVYRNFSSRSSVMDPAESLLLRKPTAIDFADHGGGQKIIPGSANYLTFLNWISQGSVRATIPDRWTPTYRKIGGNLVNPIQSTLGGDHPYAGFDLEPYLALIRE